MTRWHGVLLSSLAVAVGLLAGVLLHREPAPRPPRDDAGAHLAQLASRIGVLDSRLRVVEASLAAAGAQVSAAAPVADAGSALPFSSDEFATAVEAVITARAEREKTDERRKKWDQLIARTHLSAGEQRDLARVCADMNARLEPLRDTSYPDDDQSRFDEFERQWDAIKAAAVADLQPAFGDRATDLVESCVNI